MSTQPVTQKPRVSLATFQEATRIAADAKRQVAGKEVRIDPETRQVMDAFTNALARTGFGTTALLEGTQYPLTRLSRLYILMTALYRANWLARKIVDCPAEDMMKNWLSLVTEMPPKKLRKFDKAVTMTGTKAQLLNALKWARLFGGAGAVMVIKGHEDILDQPLDLDSIAPDSYRGLLVFDRWSGISPSATVVTDIDRPLDFQMPESYRCTPEMGNSFEVHSSRVLRFTGPGLPQWEWQAEQRWGISIYELIYDELRKFDNTGQNMANLVFRAYLIAIKSKALGPLLSGLNKSGPALQQFYNILSAQNQIMSTQGTLILGDTDELAGHTYSFAGLDAVYSVFMEVIAGAADIPVSRLFGKQNSNLGQSNAGDEHTYYDNIAQKQQRELDPQLQKLIPVIAISEWGKVPEDLTWLYRPVRSLSNDEQAELAAKLTTPIFEAYNLSAFGRQTLLRELKQVSAETNIFSNITDEMIEAADDDVEPAGESALGLDDEQLERLTTAKNAKEKENAAKVLDAMEARFNRNHVRWAWDHAIERNTAYQGMRIAIENDIGSVRSGIDPETGRPWGQMMTAPYGYLERTLGVDGDEVDCFLGPNPNAPMVYVVHTKNPKTRRFDEDKVCLGFESEAEAFTTFMDNYSDPRFFHSIESFPVAEFRDKVFRTHRGRKIARDARSKMLPQVVDVAKLTHAAVRYEHPGKMAQQSCDRCAHFVPGPKPGCLLVVDPIHSNGWCVKWESQMEGAA